MLTFCIWYLRINMIKYKFSVKLSTSFNFSLFQFSLFNSSEEKVFVCLCRNLKFKVISICNIIYVPFSS